MKKKKSDIIYVLVNILCVASLIFDIELKNYFSHLNMSYQAYIYPVIMANLAGPLIVCLLIIYRQAHHQTASFLTKIVIDSCSAIAFLAYIFVLFRYRFMPEIPPESLVLLCLFIVPAVYNIYLKITAKSPPDSDI